MSFFHSMLTIGAPLVPNQTADRASFLPFTDAGNDWQGRSNLVVNDLGEWVMIWWEATNHSDRSPNAIVNIAFSAAGDEGANWTANNIDLNGNPVVGFPLTSVSAPGVGCVMDLNFFKAPNGDLIILGQERVPSGAGTWNDVNKTITQFRSSNHGKTFAFDLDFPTAIGLSTVAQKGSIQGCYENMTIGSDIYVAAMITETVLADARTVLIKTSDSCATWSIVNNIVGVGELTYAWTECGLVYKGGTTIGVVGAPNGVNFNVVEYRESPDLGSTWGAVRSIYAELDYTGICQPTMRVSGNTVLLSGRDTKKVVGNNLLSLRDRCSVWTTPLNDIFNNNTRRNYLDPFYAGASTVSLDQGDAGYGRAIKKADGSFFYVGYWGLAGAALIYKYTVSHVDAPSQEIYANNEFLPETIQTAGVRLQCNRDNIVASPSPPVSGGIAIASRLDNYLVSPNNNYWWLGGGTVASELVIDSNGKGWMQMINGYQRSNLDKGDDFFKASYSVSMKLRPADGVPAATNVLVWSNDSTGIGLNDGITISITTAGKLLCRYAQGGTLVTAVTNASVFADGAVLNEVHVVFLVPSGGFMEIIVDGVSVALEAANPGNMSTVTMANFTSALEVFLGSRWNVAVSDLPYVGLIREVMIFPNKILNAGEIANLALL